ncbi:muscular LMNA-interacting protein isoform X2 [Cynoglossus semilaevis]|uniref:muscular LMNA-interacting protein isoform X2 n=1 Tax=Cynoglossus semilaevis TaxID=244447 RepID=UPI000D62753E|nr:muscular LMNA-interacting protein isoform X2 [Cynoglossus semilaevis]
MNSFNQTPDMISAAVPSGFHGFTFVPVLQKLPLKTLISEEWTPGVITRRDDESAVTSHETISEETMSEIFKAEMVFIKDSSATEGRGEGGNVLPSDKQLKMKPSTNYASLSGASSSGRTENTSNHITAGRASMETAVDQHRGISQWQCQDTLGRAETHKIKLSYKSLAAIPTNTLLLDQQAIDEQVERTDSPGDTMDRVDTHAEMCSPAQLRQESEELYATIDEILANSSAAPSKSSSTNIDLQQINSLQKTLGRETKYASVGSLHQPGSLERKLLDPRKTKPGVIRPMTAIPRLTVEGEEEFYKNPFRQTLADFSKVFLDVDLIYGLSVNEKPKPNGASGVRGGQSESCKDESFHEPEEREAGHGF